MIESIFLRRHLFLQTQPITLTFNLLISKLTHKLSLHTIKLHQLRNTRENWAHLLRHRLSCRLTRRRSQETNRWTGCSA